MATLSSSQKACLAAMDIPVWVRRDTPGVPLAESAVAESPIAGSAGPEQTLAQSSPGEPLERKPEKVRAEVSEPGPGGVGWEALEQQVSVCTRCALHSARTQTVFGVGNHQAEWMVIGEGPGQEEDRQGQPFVGRAGKLLDSMLEAVGQPRQQVYIANIVKCRPPNNRDPKPEEAQACSTYLARQIELVKPKIILALGRVAAQNLLHTDAPVGRMRGRVHDLPESAIPVVVTYHPAYLLRSPQQKPKAWEDLLMARRVAAGDSS